MKSRCLMCGVTAVLVQFAVFLQSFYTFNRLKPRKIRTFACSFVMQHIITNNNFKTVFNYEDFAH